MLMQERRISAGGWTKSLAIGAIAIGALTASVSCGSDAPVTPPINLTPLQPATFGADTIRLAAGASQALAATVAGVVARSADFTWKSDNSAVASVSSSGTIVGISSGVAKISATSTTATGTVTVRVADSLRSPVFRSPLAISVPVLSVFDHDLPFEFTDTNGYLLSFWGEKVTGIDGHNGYDWLVPVGTPVMAAGGGVVTFAGNETPFACTLLNNATVSGLWITIRHDLANGDVVLTQYGHFSRIDVAAGQTVTIGQQIGLSGSTGCSTVPHLHFSTFNHLPGTDNAPVSDAYGWQTSIVDPWANYPTGTPSLPIWSGANAPVLYRQFDLIGLVTSTSPVVINRIRYMGVDDDHHPNNEFLEFAANPSSGSVAAAGYRLTNLAGDSYTFPANLILTTASKLHLYSGVGTGSDTALYWGKTSPTIGNVTECLRVFDPHGVLSFIIGWGTPGCGVTAELAPANSRTLTIPNAADGPSPYAVMRLGPTDIAPRRVKP